MLRVYIGQASVFPIFILFMTFNLLFIAAYFVVHTCILATALFRVVKMQKSTGQVGLGETKSTIQKYH
jgi:hypothetical protein